MSGRFRFTSGGVSVLQPKRTWRIERDVASRAYLSAVDASGALAPRRLTLSGLAESFVFQSFAERVAAFKSFFAAMDSALASGGRVRIDDLMFNRYCDARLLSVSGREGRAAAAVDAGI